MTCRINRVLWLLILGLTVFGVGTAWAAPQHDGPVTVSPGSATGLLIGETCPTFSWGAMAGAKGYELVAYQLRGKGEEARPVLQQRVSGSALSWTPSLDRCLERGGRYAWSVRAVNAEGESGWSQPSLFEVASVPTEMEFEEALQVVRRYLAPQGGPGGEGVAKAGRESGPEVSGPSTTAPAPAAVGPTQLSVDGGVAATSFTGDGSTLTNLDPANLSGGECEGFPISGRRYIDRGDGTVRDCNTGKIWLKDASCLGSGLWDSGGTAGTVQAKVADLNNGTDFSCSGYTPGTYTDWEVPAMDALCGLWDKSCTGSSCCTASQGIVDASVSGEIKVANGTGDSR